MNQGSISTFSQRLSQNVFYLILISALLVFTAITATLSSAAPATPADNWKIVFDTGIDAPFNYSTSFTPKVWLYNQSNKTVAGATVTYTYFDVNGNSQIATGTATNNGDGSYRGAALNMPNYDGKYINVLFSVSAGSNILREQHVYYAGLSNGAHGALWKIEVFNTSMGPSWNGNSQQKIYMRLYSDAGTPYRNNLNTPTIAIWDSGGTSVLPATAMTYEEDGVYSYSISGYANGDYYFEIYNRWSSRQVTGSSSRYTIIYDGLYLEANNTQNDESLPQIDSVNRKPYFPVDDDYVNITAQALDNFNITSATLYYTVNNQTVQTKPMVKQSGLEYKGTIDPYLLEDNVRYRIEVSDGTSAASSDWYLYNVQDSRGSANMSHSFISHPAYWFGKSRQASFPDRGGDTNYDGIYSSSEIDNVVYLSVPNEYPYFKDMTRIKVQTLIMDETGKPVQHLTNVRAWLSNNTTQAPGTHNREKIMTEVTGESGVYNATWEGSANVTGSNLNWSNDAKAIWGKYNSGEIYSVYIDVNNDSRPEENITWLAYNLGDTFWGSTENGRTFSSHSDLETPGSTCSRSNCHNMVGGIATRTAGDPTCPDCHGVYKGANNGNWPVSTGATNDKIVYGNSTGHPRQNNTNATYCGDDTCHNVAWNVTSSSILDIPGYPAGTRLNGTFRAEYPNPIQCAEHHNYKGSKIPVAEGHNRMVACKYCHGGNHDNSRLIDYNISVMGNLSNVKRGTPGYVGSGGVNGSGTYAGNCYQDCHKVQVDHSLTGIPGGAIQNKVVPCDECHQNFNNAPMHQENVFPYKDRETCGGCHQAQGVITSHNTSITLNPPRMPSPLIHADQSGTSWNKTGARPYWVENENSCRYCHGRSYNQAYGLGRIEDFFGINIINGTINSTSYWCASCHVDNASETHYNYSAMVSVYNYSFGVVPPEITGSTWKSDRSGYDDHNITGKINKLDPGTYSDEKCFTCHGGNLLQSAGLDAFLHNVSHGKSGNADCISCHDAGGSLSAGKKVNFTAMNDINAIHKNLNSNASNGSLSDENKKCWACHGDGTKPSGGHPANYKTPFKCVDCHVPGSGQNLMYNPNNTLLNVTEHYWNGTNIDTSVTSCYSCHNRSEMMLGLDLDPDGAGNVYGGANGGNYSSSHYGKKRNDLVSLDTTTYCNYCHNSSTNNSTFYVSNFNNTILNHTSRTSTPLCSDCHNTGRIHDSSFVKPVSNDAFCLSCHGTGGTATTNNKANHKTLYCTECHANSITGALAGKDIHAIKYLTKTNTFETTTTNAADCVTCHLTTSVDSSITGFTLFKIMNPLQHSNEVNNGSIWGNYWTSPQTACIYCHNDTKHNASPLGRILQWSPNYQMYTSIGDEGNCADCHYKGGINYSQMSSSFTPGLIPPEITNGTNWNGIYSNYTNHSLANYSDQMCKSCHGSQLNGSANMSEFLHKVAKGVSGGPDCISCHNIGGTAGSGNLVNFSEMNNTSAIHSSLNNNATTGLSPENKKCWACHGNGIEPAAGSHPSNYKNPYKCEYCHVLNNYSAQIIQNHRPGNHITTAGRSVNTTAYCSTCHNNSISIYDTNNILTSVRVNASVSHYGTNASILRPTVNKTPMPRLGFMNTADAGAYNIECTNCHNPSNQNYGNSTQITVAHTSTGVCNECHVNVSASDLHNGSLGIPQTFGCLDCHTIYASRYRAPNLTGTQMPSFGATSCEGCHGGDTATGLFDTQDKHNVGRDYPGTPGNTDNVYLNNQIALTVTNGTPVTISSRVNDISGPNNYASRVGGAEYYIDIDPGYGNGIPMDAADGQYDAVEGAWEDVTATIDTSTLQLGTHAVFVRGMDIGKQWSASQNAVLIIQSGSQQLAYIPPAPVINGSMQGNFWINHTWLEGAGNVTDSYNLSVNGLWTNGTTITYSNISVGPHGWSNVTVLAYNNSGSGKLSLTSASNNTRVNNHIPVQAQIGNKVVAEGDMLTFTVSATDADSDPMTNSTNATKGTFNPATGEFSWNIGYGDAGIYTWSFNSSDSYGGLASETITVTVNNVPLSITSFTPLTDPVTTVGNPQTFMISLNRTANVTWYINGSSVQSDLGVISVSYSNSTAGIGVYNVTATTTDDFDFVSKKWNWTVTQQPSYNVSGYTFDNYGLGLGGVQVQNGSKSNITSASGYYSITGLFNGTYNISYSKAGFNTGYLEITINGANNANVNKTIFDLTPPAQVTGFKNDTPTQTTVNLTWNVTADTNYYQVFRNSSSLGYTGNNYWNDTGLTANTSYQYWVRANDSYNNWGQNSSILIVVSAPVPDFTSPASVSNPGTATGNFFINNTWTNPADSDFSYAWFRYSNGTTLQNVSKPANYLNITWVPHYTQNISAQTVDASGNTNQTKVWFNATISNNPPLQAPVGNKTLAENQLLQFTVSATDADSDIIIYGTNATKGTFNTAIGQLTWTPGYGDAGIYTWYFNSSDSYGGLASETITVTVNNVPLSITSFTPLTDPVTTVGNPQTFVISLNRTANVTWYINGSSVQSDLGVISANYTNSTAGIGVYNVTATTTDDFDFVSKKWNWTVTQQPSYNVSGYTFDNYGLGLGGVQVQNSSKLNITSTSGYYSITGLFNGTYNISYSKAGFNTGYLEVTINGANNANVNKTIFDLTPPAQVTGFKNDTPTQTTVNLTWNVTADTNYYQVFRNSSSLGYTGNNYWNDTGLTANTSYQYWVRANDSYNNWGQNSSILIVVSAPVPDFTSPASVSNPGTATGNFFINNTWTNPADSDFSYAWFRYSNGTTLQNVSKPANYLNITRVPHYTQNISAQTVDASGNTNQTKVWFNATIPNNLPNQSAIGNKTIAENQLLQFTVSATDADSDIIIYGTNATKGTFNGSNGQFSWTPAMGDSGVYFWYFNSSDGYGGIASEKIKVTVNPSIYNNCLGCHTNTQGGYPGIVQASFSKHKNVNTIDGQDILNNSDCITCHYDVTNMTQPGFTTKTLTCTDCHTQGNFSAPIIMNHRPGGVNIKTNAYCSTCHNNSVNMFAYNPNTSVSHYGTNSSLLKPTVNHTTLPELGLFTNAEAQAYNNECTNCHNNYPFNSTYGNATTITVGHTSEGTCNQCHLNTDASDLHNGSLIKPVTSSCIECHTKYADAYKAPNLTNTNHMGYTCTYTCHVPVDYGTLGQFDPADHDTDWEISPGNPPTTDFVNLNGAASSTVSRGVTVLISSRIKDYNFLASRVRGAEYYIDSDPGSGKGNVMSAVDGRFDAFNGGWENISGTIDTSILSVGMHTVYVRGMDIGKQWSTSVTATLNVTAPTGFINGTVRNTTGAVLPGTRVTTNSGVSSDTDSSGFYSLSLTNGTYTLTATKLPEYNVNNTIPQVTVTASTTVTQEIFMTKKATGSIRGAVGNV